MALALVLIAGIFAYQHFAGRPSTAARQDATVQNQNHNQNQNQNPSTASKPKLKTSPAAVQHTPRHMRISLRATRDCWVQLTSTRGTTLFSGMVYAGNSMNWTERHPVTMVLGNPSGVRLLVNGRNPIPRGSVSTVTLRLRAGPAH
jgi:cytoskeletal protein RodZ